MPPRNRVRTTLFRTLAAATLLAAVATGCSRYRFGVRAAYPRDIVTIYVPIFRSESYRRNVGEQLTEAVIKQITSRTPYEIVAHADEADAVLSGRIVVDGKRTLVESPTDEPRVVGYDMQVVVQLTDRYQNELASSVMAPSAIVTEATSSMIPEAGDSTQITREAIINDLAKQIVDLLESPW